MAGKNQITGGAFQDFTGSVLANGYLTMQLSHDEQETFDPGNIVSGYPLRVGLDANGNIAGSIFLWPNDQLNPAGSYYIVSAFRSDGTQAWSSPQFQTVTSAPSPFNVGTWVPNNPPAGGAQVGTIVLQTSGLNNASQSLLNLAAGSNVSLVNSAGTTTITASGGGGGTGPDTVLLANTSQALSLPVNTNLYVDATAGAGGISLTFPSAAGLGGQKITVIMVDTGAGGVTLIGTISGNSSYVLTNQWQSVVAESNNTSWRAVATAG